MFFWLKKVQLAKQKKLLYQNHCAAQVLQDWFDNDAEIVSRLKAIGEENCRIASSLPEGHFVTFDGMKVVLGMNKELRRLFDQTATRHVDTFDNCYKPPIG